MHVLPFDTKPSRLKSASKAKKDQKFYVRSDRLLEATVRKKTAYRPKCKYLTKYKRIQLNSAHFRRNLVRCRQQHKDQL